MIVFRGVNFDLWKVINDEKVIKPKGLGLDFEITFKHDGSIRYDGSATFGSSIQNAVNGHQISSDKFPTSGISTTPIWERAMYYALRGLNKGNGVILEMNLNNLDKSEFEWHEINKLIANPTCREDNEILIRRFDNGVFPLSLFKIHEIII